VEIIAETAEWNLEHKSRARLEKRFDGNFADTEIKIAVSLWGLDWLEWCCPTTVCGMSNEVQFVEH